MEKSRYARGPIEGFTWIRNLSIVPTAIVLSQAQKTPNSKKPRHHKIKTQTDCRALVPTTNKTPRKKKNVRRPRSKSYQDRPSPLKNSASKEHKNPKGRSEQRSVSFDLPRD